MANPERGEVALTVGDRSYKLVLDFDGICQVEDVLSTPAHIVTFPEAILHSARGSHRHARALIWGALQRFHPTVSLEQAGELIVELGGVEQAFETIAKLRKSAEPDKADRRPRKARPVNGTGVPAISSGGA